MYWSPSSVWLQSTPLTTKLKSPSAAGCPIPGLAGDSGAASSAGAGASTTPSAPPLVAAVDVAPSSLPPPRAEPMTAMTKSAATTRNQVFF